jgi:hypothetical protein
MESAEMSLADNCAQDNTYVIMEKDMGELMPAFNLTKTLSEVLPQPPKTDSEQMKIVSAVSPPSGLESQIQVQESHNVLKHVD